jgi:hypothetical protein
MDAGTPKIEMASATNMMKGRLGGGGGKGEKATRKK